MFDPMRQREIEDFWLSLKGFTQTTSQHEVTKEALYEMLEHKVLIKQMLVDQSMFGHENIDHSTKSISKQREQVAILGQNVTSIEEAIEMARQKK